jgi:hypothetical protein
MPPNEAVTGKVQNDGGAVAAATGTTMFNTIVIPDRPNAAVSFMIGNKWADFAVQKDPTQNLEFIESPAILLVVSVAKGDVKFITNKFYLQGITKPKMERFQIVETFGESKLFFFGERTKVYSINGIVIEAQNADMAFYDSYNYAPPKMNVDLLANDDWANFKKEYNKFRWSTALQTLYDNELRGTQLAKNGNIAALYVDKTMIQGYPVQLQTSRDANNPAIVQFQMTWVIYKEQFLDTGGVNALYEVTSVSSTARTELLRLHKILKDAEAKYDAANDANYEANQSNDKAKMEMTLAKVHQCHTDRGIAEDNYAKSLKLHLYGITGREPQFIPETPPLPRGFHSAAKSWEISE